MYMTLYRFSSDFEVGNTWHWKALFFLINFWQKRWQSSIFGVFFFQNQIFSKSGKYVLALNVLSLKEINFVMYTKNRVFSVFSKFLKKKALIFFTKENH